MNLIPNRQAVCDILLQRASADREIVVLCSDSRGSASLAPFAEAFPKQFVEVGIAEQNLVSMAAGLASCGKKAFAVSPACFLSTRSMEQIKVDVAYSETNVKLIGISGGVSYGPLGMTHHSAQDIATMASIPNMRCYFPSDRFQTKALISALLDDSLPAYVRVGRNAVADIYSEKDAPFTLNKATLLQDGSDITIIACGETVQAAKSAGEALKEKGVSARVLDMCCIKPIDSEAVIKAATETKAIITVEEHGPIGGMGSMVCKVTSAKRPIIVKCLSLPDSPVITGKSAEVFKHYGLDADGIEKTAFEVLEDV